MGLRLSTPAFYTKYEILGILGEGSFGVVYKARNRNTNEVHAVKKLKLTGNVTQHEKFVREEAILNRTIGHPHIVKLIGSFIDEDNSLCIIMEFCELGDLNRYVTTTYVPVDLKVLLMYDMSSGLDFLHQINIVHRDMKPGNVLVTWSQFHGRPVCKISDFGEAKMQSFAGQLFQMAPYPLGSYLTSFHGTMAYIAPEVFGNHYTSSCDVFSLGVIFYALFSAYLYNNMTKYLNPFVDGQYMYAARDDKIRDAVNGLRCQVSCRRIQSALKDLETLPTELRDLILNMLKKYYHERVWCFTVKLTLSTYIIGMQMRTRQIYILT